MSSKPITVSVALAGLCICCAVLAACGPSYEYGFGPGPLPEPEKGPANFSGTLTINAPVFAYASAPLASVSDGAIVPLKFPADLGMIRPPNIHAEKLIELERGSYATNDPVSGRYTIGLDFRDLPYGQYNLRFFDVFIAVDAWGYWDMYNSEAITLAPGSGDVTGWSGEFNAAGAGPTGVLEGRVLLSGNPDLSEPVEVELAPEWTRYNNYGSNGSLRYSIPASAFEHGRAFFRIEGLAYGRHTGGTYGALMTPGPAGERWQRDLVLSAEQPQLEVLAEHYTDYWATRYDPREYQERYRDAAEIQVALDLGGAMDWDGDIVIEAVREGGGTSALHSCRTFSLPGYTDDNGMYWGSLRPLQEGSYIVRVLLLGPDNATAPVELARSETVLLALGPPIQVPIDDRIDAPTFMEYQPIVEQIELSATLP
jgi:hypothetical protein